MMRPGTLLRLLLLALLLAAPLMAWAEEPVPEEYGKDEFSPLLRDLRRGEIILFGSFPFTLFLTFEVYDFYRYASHDWAREYSPWPFRSPGAAPYEPEEAVGVLVTAVSLSALLALADFVIGKIREQRAENPPPDRH
jgi:hypothetical protein